MHAINIDTIHPSEANPRRRMDPKAFEELTESIRRLGVLQPVLVRKRETKAGYELIAGHRRLAASKAAGLDEVPAIVRDMTDAEALEVQLVENVERADIHPLDEAAGYARLMTVHKYDAQRIADRIGRSARYVYDRVKLLQLIPDLQTMFLDGRISAGHAVVLARLTPADQLRASGQSKLDRDGGLFEHEDLLWNPNEDRDPKGPHRGMKVRTVAELQGWVDNHVRFEPKQADPVLFEETLSEVDRARKVVPITRANFIHPTARSQGRTFSPRAWKRADGEKEGGKPTKKCEHSITGFVAVGPGRGEAFAVCVAKEKCTTHWGSEIRERAKNAARATGGGSKGKATGGSTPAPKKYDEGLLKEIRRVREIAGERTDRLVMDAAAAATPEEVLRQLLAASPWMVSDYLSTGPRPSGANPKAWVETASIIEIKRAVALGVTEAADVAFGVDLNALITAAERQAAADYAAEKKAKPGTCIACGCTEDAACEGGCSWVNKQETRCSACFDAEGLRLPAAAGKSAKKKPASKKSTSPQRKKK